VKHLINHVGNSEFSNPKHVAQKNEKMKYQGIIHVNENILWVTGVEDEIEKKTEREEFLCK